MRNQNNMDLNKNKTEITVADIELAVMLFMLASVAFAAGYYVASVRIAAIMASNN